ncbi:transposase [Intestinibacter sp.]
MITLKKQSTFNNLHNSNIKAAPNFFELFNQYINLDNIIHPSFKQRYYLTVSSKRKYSLESMIKFFILKNIFNHIHYVDTLRLLQISKELKSFCGFDEIPHASQISRFANKFLKNINEVFHTFVDITNPMVKEHNQFLSSILIADTTGFEAYVKENNPKYYETLLRKAKNIAKTNSNILFAGITQLVAFIIN